MAKQKHVRLGELQLRIMQVLWRSAQPVTVADVQRRLGGTPLAYTTVATMLRKMEDRELVSHQEDGRKYLYQPIVSADQVSRNIGNDLVDRLFDGRLADAVSHLLETREVAPDELDELEQLIRKHKRLR